MRLNEIQKQSTGELQRQSVNVVSGHQSGSRQNKKSIYAGSFGQKQELTDRIHAKKEQAKKRAMKLVGDAFAGDRALDEDMQKRREHVVELGKEKQRLQSDLKDLEERQSVLDQAYRNGEVSEEDYLEETNNLKEGSLAYQREFNAADEEMVNENNTIRLTRRERLKSDPMGKAKKQADQILDQASEDVISMVFDDAKEKIDEEDEERKETASELQKKREEEKEFIEKQQDKCHDKSQEMDDLLNDPQTKGLLAVEGDRENVKQEVQKILDKAKLLAEDIKGAAVDEIR